MAEARQGFFEKSILTLERVQPGITSGNTQKESSDLREDLRIFAFIIRRMVQGGKYKEADEYWTILEAYQSRKDFESDLKLRCLIIQVGLDFFDSNNSKAYLPILYYRKVMQEMFCGFNTLKEYQMVIRLITKISKKHEADYNRFLSKSLEYWKHLIWKQNLEYRKDKEDKRRDNYSATVYYTSKVNKIVRPLLKNLNYTLKKKIWTPQIDYKKLQKYTNAVEYDPNLININFYFELLKMYVLTNRSKDAKDLFNKMWNERIKYNWAESHVRILLKMALKYKIIDQPNKFIEEVRQHASFKDNLRFLPKELWKIYYYHAKKLIEAGKFKEALEISKKEQLSPYKTVRLWLHIFDELEKKRSQLRLQEVSQQKEATSV